MTKRIVCFGTHILDTLARPVSKIPEDQNSARVEQIAHTAAGPAAGVAVDIAHLGFPVSSVGVAGTDATGDFLLQLLENAGVDARVSRLEGAQTSSSVLLIDAEGNRPALHVRGVNAVATWADIDVDVFDDAGWVHLGGLDALSALSNTRESLRVIETLHARGVVVTMDFQSASAHLSAELRALVAAVDVFMPNDEQAMGLAGVETVEAAATGILDLGPGAVIITCGAEGLYYADQDGVRLQQSAVSVEVVDTTGCGDSVAATYLVARSQGMPLDETLRVAVEAGAAVAAGLGSLGSLPDWNTLISRAQMRFGELQ